MARSPAEAATPSRPLSARPARRRPPVAPRTRIRSVFVARPARAPNLHLRGPNVVQGHAGQAVALGGGRGLPDALGEGNRACDRSPPIELHVADHEDDDRVVGKGGSQTGQDVAKEHEIWLAVVGIVEAGIDRPGVEAQQPRRSQL